MATLLILNATATDAHKIAWGGVPTWIAVIGAIVGAAAALGQLRAQRKEIARQAWQLDRQQASRIALTWCAATEVRIQAAPPDPVPGAGHTVVIVSNDSSRPIRDVSCHIEPGPPQGGRLDPQNLEPAPDGDPFDFTPARAGTHSPLLFRAGSKYGFLFEFIIPREDASNPAARVSVRFIDDADLSWQIDENLRLKRLPAGRR